MSDASGNDHIIELLRQGMARQAATEVGAALALDPDDATLLSFLADARTDVDPEQALEPALRAAARRPDDPATLVTLARVQWLCGRPGPARETIDRAVELAPDWADANIVRAIVHLDAAQRGVRTSPDLFLVEQARASAQRATECAPRSPLAFVVLGQIHLADHDHDRAGQAAAAALELDPGHLDAQILLGDIHLAGGDARRATNHYFRARPSPAAIDRLRTQPFEPWPPQLWGLALAVFGAATVLRLAGAPVGAGIGASLLAGAIGIMILVRLVLRVRGIQAARRRDTRRLLGSDGELAERTRPGAPALAGAHLWISSEAGGRPGPSA